MAIENDGQRKCLLSFHFEWGTPAYLWAADNYTRDTLGYGPLEDDLNLPDELLQRGEALSDWYQTALNWDYPPDPGPWRQEECERFKVAVRALFEDLKQTLAATCDLLYHQYEPDEDPDLDIYLKNPKDFRRS